MVPHLSIESALMEVAGLDEHQVAVTSLPDPKQGERLCVLYTGLALPPAEVHRRLMAGRLPRLWISSVRDFIRVERIPITATGKIDLRSLREIGSGPTARERAGDSRQGRAIPPILPLTARNIGATGFASRGTARIPPTRVYSRSGSL